MTKSFINPVTTGAGLLAAVLSLADARAIEPNDLLVFSKGPVVLRPQFVFQEQFNDNVVYDQQGAETADLVSTLGAGISAQIGRRGRFQANLDYMFHQTFYLDRTDLNSGNHVIALRSRYNGSRLTITGLDQIYVLSDVLGGGAGLREPIDRVSFVDDYQAVYRIGTKTSAHIGGRHDSTDYEEGKPLYDHNSLRGTLGFGYLPFSKTTLFGEVYYGKTTSTPNFPAIKGPDLEFLGGFLGARGEFTERLVGHAKLGFEMRQFGDASDAPWSPVFDISLDYRVSEKTAASLVYARVTGISSQAASESYTVDFATIRLNQRLGRTGKWSAALAGNLSNYNFESAQSARGRHDVLYGVDASINYRMQRWLTGSFEYSFGNFTSDQQGIIDYAVNRVTLRVSIGY